jgi:hypothetical protein
MALRRTAVGMKSKAAWLPNPASSLADRIPVRALESGSLSPACSGRLRFRDVLGAVAVGSLHRIDGKFCRTPKYGLTYSQTTSPAGVASKKSADQPSLISVLPFGSRCAFDSLGLKKSARRGS